jgi:hypothetical protein
MGPSEKVLVVAFDGMDKELIDEFDLDYIPQEEFGGIDNSTGISRRMTSELFASFITGENHSVHGVKGLDKSLNKWDRLVDYIIPDFAVNRVRGFHRLKQALTFADEFDSMKHTKDDLDEETLFEKIDASLPLYVPSYNPESFWLLAYPHELVKYGEEERFIKECRYDTDLRLNNGTATQPAFNDITKSFWDFIMLHLHDPDGFQDTGYGDLKQEYERLDEIAGRILEEYEEWTVIFMSDHGRPEKEGSGLWEHNENAFYSCNRELFEDETPHITDFHDKILNLTGNK